MNGSFFKQMVALAISALGMCAPLAAQTDSTAAEPSGEVKKEVFQFVEQMPEFPGGQEAMYKFISKNLVYPASARDLGKQGKVILRFKILDNGQIADVEAINNPKLGYGLEQEAIRVVRIMPDWSPGKQMGTPVNVYFTLPISFKLN